MTDEKVRSTAVQAVAAVFLMLVMSEGSKCGGEGFLIKTASLTGPAKNRKLENTGHESSRVVDHINVGLALFFFPLEKAFWAKG
jgi:hypothetical protein